MSASKGEPAMAKPAHVHRLESYGLTLAAVMRLGARKVGATVQLSGKTARALWGLPASDRQGAVRETLVRQLKRLERAVPEATFAPRNRRKPWTIDATLPARSLPTLAAAPSVAYVFVNSIEGRVATPEKPKFFPNRVRWTRFCSNRRNRAGFQLLAAGRGGK
jgi:hypothetical protein